MVSSFLQYAVALGMSIDNVCSENTLIVTTSCITSTGCSIVKTFKIKLWAFNTVKPCI